MPAEDNRSLNSCASSLLRFRCFISAQTPRSNLAAMDAASQIGLVDCSGIIGRVTDIVEGAIFSCCMDRPILPTPVTPNLVDMAEVWQLRVQIPLLYLEQKRVTARRAAVKLCDII